jgi:hypothetical protein
MTCSTSTDTLMGLVSGGLSDDEELELRGHLEGCPACRAEVEELTILWADLGTPDLDVPSDRLRQGVEATIQAFADPDQSEPVQSRPADPTQGSRRRLGPRWAAGLAAAAVLGGLFGRGLVVRDRAELIDRLGTLETRAAQELLTQPDAGMRLETVLGLMDAEGSSPERRDVLERMLSFDESPNVRIAAVEALASVSPDTFAGLVLRSLPAEPSVPVRMAMLTALRPRVNASDLEALRVLLGDLALDDLLREPIRLLIAEAGP